MKVLIVKTSSLGDIIHTLPVLSDALKVNPSIQFDWLVEEAFCEAPAWHPGVISVIPVAWRRWRKNFFLSYKNREIQRFFSDLRAQSYDLIIDAQGLLKSALMARLAIGPVYGPNYISARESFAPLFYHHRQALPSRLQAHAVVRMRQLFAGVFGYTCPDDFPDYGIRSNLEHLLSSSTSAVELPKKSIILIHGTTTQSKEWPVEAWIALAKRCIDAGFKVQLSWGNEQEKARAQAIAAVSSEVNVLPKGALTDLAALLLHTKAGVGVDTGLSHLAAALDIPFVSLYGPTDPNLVGTIGHHQAHLASQTGLMNFSVDEVCERLFAYSSLMG